MRLTVLNLGNLGNLVKGCLSNILQPCADRREGRQLGSARCGSSRWGVKGNRDLPTENSSPIHSHSRPFTPKEHPLPRGSPICQPCLSSLCRPHPDPCPWDCVLRLVGVGQGPQPDQYRALQSLRGAFAGPCLLEWGEETLLSAHNCSSLTCLRSSQSPSQPAPRHTAHSGSSLDASWCSWP